MTLPSKLITRINTVAKEGNHTTSIIQETMEMPDV